MKTDVQIKDEPMEISVKIFFIKKYSENISFAQNCSTKTLHLSDYNQIIKLISKDSRVHQEQERKD